MVDRPETLRTTLNRIERKLNETAVFRTVLERFRTDLTTFDAKIDDWKASSFGVYFLLKAHYCCMLSIEKTKQNKETDPFNSFFLPRIGRISPVNAGIRQKQQKTLALDARCLLRAIDAVSV